MKSTVPFDFQQDEILEQRQNSPLMIIGTSCVPFCRR